jgi:hypothetical protein
MYKYVLTIFMLIKFQVTSFIPLVIAIEPEGKENVPTELHIFSEDLFSINSLS